MSEFEVVVLGSAGTHPSRQRVCSGYLLRTSTTNLLIDCGNGSTHTLQRFCDLDELDAVVISHRHADHCVDLVGAYYALRFHDGGQRRIDVHAPPGTAEMLAGLVGDSTETFREICRFHDIGPGDQLDVGDVRLDFFEANHSVPTVAIRATVDGRVVCYSGDSGGGDGLIAAASGADLFICEASWQGPRTNFPSGLHLTAAEAGRIAAEAGAGRLVLTHIWPANDLSVSRAEAEAHFGADVSLAEDGQVLTVTSD